ncbi:nitrate reductase molybdenum cofactor assembly chaperone [Conexibacter stalactiti]|uniref:Nitrate reductase molybdenum cofactor assembly chaperone n=1 Tax=Conexibacter stalactiti TaxID=1940611 RepID=A0ABU4HSB3_9ACTN|nr:nitrate reductase molybdenum cofactor assembly chaperone [Conexibacter stalactiti]MDW5595567.1 nitrate reductase molybdenum cofactor assembly chaperone [Conexibacter stalactiti]MEC5036209.1 nitrate reductase molybdenum cofactor assembly chaperone [Conexibacter stalactiti]
MSRVARLRGRGPEPRAFAVASWLLRYPDARLLAGRDELADAAARLRHRRVREPLARFAAAFAAAPDGRALQERWIETFEVRRRTGLYLTYFSHGDTRERGVALLRLRKLYRAAGLPMESGELPDFLPVMLEFAGSAPDGYGEALLREHRAGLELLRIALRDAESPYADVVDAVAIALGAPDEGAVARVEKLLREGPPQERVGVELPGAA